MKTERSFQTSFQENDRKEKKTRSFVGPDPPFFSF
jgi:hypothetical protein